MRAILLSVGSRGDVEPYCVLTKELLQRGIQVDLFVQRNLTYLSDPFLDHSCFRRHTFPFDHEDFYKATKASSPSQYSDLNPPDSRMIHVAKVADIIRELVLPFLSQVLQILDDPSRSSDCTIVTSAFTRPLALLIAHARDNFPVILLHLQPLLPNRIFPSYRTWRRGFVDACLQNQFSHLENAVASTIVSPEKGLAYDESYWKVEHALEECFLKDPIQKAQEQNFSVQASPPSWDELKEMLTGKAKNVWVVNAYSNHLVPPLAGSDGLGANILDVGPIADDYIPPGHEQLDPMLQRFLSEPCFHDNEKPICVGFGSMPFGRIGQLLEAIKTLKVRAVLVGEIFRQIPQDHPAIRYQWITCISAVPYALLLPHCSMLLCHGGIGVTQACLRAGIPCLISPLMGDQFAIAQLVQAKGLGVQCGSKLSEVTSEDIIRAVGASRKCIDTCKNLRCQIQMEKSSGAAKIVALILRIMEK